MNRNMPKPGKYNNKPSWKDQYDDSYRSDTKKVSFKSNRHGNKQDNRNKNWGNTLRAHFEDEDIDMGGSSGTARSFHNGNKKKFNRKNNKKRYSPPPPLRNVDTNAWYKVYVPNGSKFDKKYLMEVIEKKLQPLQFWPIEWTTSGNGIVFYVDDFRIANTLKAVDGDVQMPNGMRLLFKVDMGSPNIIITTELKERLKAVMAKRYAPATKALDLSRFHADPDLQDTFCGLVKANLFETVLGIICEFIPELEALKLDDNKLLFLPIHKTHKQKLRGLKILHLKNNKIRDFTFLDKLQDFPLIELVLDENPLCKKYKDKSSYISEVRKRFPKVIKLDGADLPPPIGFDIQDKEMVLPSTKQTFLCNAEGQLIVRQFLEQYILIFDSDDRQPLLQAYHEEATFSLTMEYPFGNRKDKNVAWLNFYNTDDRNLLKVEDTERRYRLLKKGREDVVSYLRDMPETKHDIHSFTVDLTLFTPVMLSLTFSGMFKELKSGHKVPPLRFFFRTFVIVPAGSGFCILNEFLHITNALPDQAKEAFKGPYLHEVSNASISAPSTPVSSVVNSPVVTPVVAPPVPVLDDITKQQMVQAISEQTTMNLEWSLRCLEETQWDYNRAVSVFGELQKQGKVPAEAFVKS